MHRSLATWPHELIIDHNVGRSYRGESLDPRVSVKCMFNGQTRYSVDGREFTIDDDAYVVLNDGHAYSFEKRSKTPVETFCVFFPRGLMESVLRDLTSSDASLLDLPVAGIASTLNFFEHRRPHGDRVSRRVKELRSASRLNRLSEEV